MKYIVLTWVDPWGNSQQNGIFITSKDEMQGNKAWSFVPVSISPRSDGVLTWITPGDTVIPEYARGWLTPPPTRIDVVVTTSKACDL